MKKLIKGNLIKRRTYSNLLHKKRRKIRIKQKNKRKKTVQLQRKIVVEANIPPDNNNLLNYMRSKKKWKKKINQSLMNQY